MSDKSHTPFVLLVTILFGSATLTITAAIPDLQLAQEDLHLGVTIDCGDGKTFTKLGVKWTSFPVTYSISAPDVNSEAAIDRGFATYEALEHPAGQLFSKQAGSGQGIDVSFAPIDGALGILAQTRIWYNVVTKAIVEVNIVFDSAESWAVFPALACGSQGEGIDVEAVAAHELGHGVGLGHSSSSTALTMYPFYSLGATKQRTLATGDVKGVSAIYK